MPFFDRDIAVDIEIAQGGGWRISVMPDGGPLDVFGTSDETNWLALKIDTLEFTSAGTTNPTSNLRLNARLSLKLQDELYDDIPLPGLVITGKGELQLQGGWLPLKKPISAKLGPFSLQISRIGLGTTPTGDRQLSLDAAIQLAAGFPAGASAKGLRLTFAKDWSSLKGISFDGIGLDFTIPKVLNFKGEVAMKQADGKTTFEGSVKVALYAIDAFVDGQVRFGEAWDEEKKKFFKYFAIKLDLELSKGIRIFNTGLALYGMTGLFAYNYAPNKTSAEKWFAIDGSGWLQKPPAGVAELSKWTAKADTLAFGAGVTVDTKDDDGKAFNGKFLLLVTLPGPVVFLEGRANLMKDRRQLKNDAAFRAYSVFDGLAGTALFGLDARWRYPDGGELIDVAGSSEAFFDFHDTSKWYVKVGLETPESARVKAKLVSLVEADAACCMSASGARPATARPTT